MNEQDKILAEAINAGMKLLCSEDVKVSANDLEALANFKNILRGILKGELILASPDRIIPEDDGSTENVPGKIPS